MFVVLVVQFLFPPDPHNGEAGLGTPWWAMVLILAYTFVTSFGCCYIYVGDLLVVSCGWVWLDFVDLVVGGCSQYVTTCHAPH